MGVILKLPVVKQCNNTEMYKCARSDSVILCFIYLFQSPLSQTKKKFRNVNHDTLLNIRYENDVLTVSTNFEEKKSWTECFSVKALLPTGYFFGVSAMTGLNFQILNYLNHLAYSQFLGDFSDSHLLYGLDFQPLGDGEPQYNDTEIVPHAKYFIYKTYKVVFKAVIIKQFDSRHIENTVFFLVALQSAATHSLMITDLKY
jgi:hypothetical protein